MSRKVGAEEEAGAEEVMIHNGTGPPKYGKIKIPYSTPASPLTPHPSPYKTQQQ